MAGMLEGEMRMSPKVRARIKVILTRKRLIARATEERFIAEEDVIARLHRNIDLPFPPFPGLLIKLGKDKNLVINSVLYDHTTGTTELSVDTAVLSDKEAETQLPELLHDGWVYD